MKSSLAWIAQWARTAVAAVTDFKSYRALGTRKLGEAVGHLAMLTVLWALPITVMFFVGLREFSGAISRGLREDIPAGTVFELKGGKLTNNLSEPLVFREKGATVIINTATTTLDLVEGESGLMVDAEAVTTQDGPRRESVSFHDAPDFRVDREGLMAAISRWAPLALFVASLVALIFMFLAFWTGMLLNALVHGMALWLIFKLIKRPRPWKETFIVAAYAGTASILLGILLQGFGRLSPLPDIVYWAYIAWIAYDAYKGGTHERKEAAADRPRTEGESGPV